MNKSKVVGWTVAHVRTPLCKHREIIEVPGSMRGYSHSVARYPYTDENRAAHGSICITERCLECGSERQTLINRWQREHSPWGPDTATLAAREAARIRSLEAAQRAEDARILAKSGAGGEVTNITITLPRDQWSRALESMPDLATHVIPRDSGRKPYGHRAGEAEVLARMRAMRADGSSYNAIAAALNKDKVPTRGTRHGRGLWLAESVRKILMGGHAAT